jgi:hypothetical protein
MAPMSYRDDSASQSHFFAFGRSTRTSRNSSGPLVSRRWRWARSSGGAEGSMIFSIAFRGEILSAQLMAGLADVPRWRLGLEPDLDQAADGFGARGVVRFGPGLNFHNEG